jgi:acetyl-CoA C-acetyltransferase
MSAFKNVVIASYARSPIGSFLGSLSDLSAVELGSHAIKSAVGASRLEPSEIQYGIVGQVVSAGCGQAPGRQAMVSAGVPVTSDVFMVNKVCSSGMKAISLAAQSIAQGEIHTCVAAGMESMSSVPHVMRKARQGGYKLGQIKMDDLVISDGLWDVYSNIHMGSCAEKTNRDYGITRREQDEYALESYKRAAEAWSSGRILDGEVVPISTGKSAFEKDEEVERLRVDKVGSLKPAFEEKGSVTAANASKLNDGAAAVVLTSEEFARSNGLRPLARIVGWADFATNPIDFSIAPRGAIEIALKRSNLSVRDIDYWEINEAFSCVPIVNARLLKIDLSRVNVDGGAVALGHPIGMSGTRIVGALTRILRQRDGTVGCAAICNGGGGSSVIVIERL